LPDDNELIVETCSRVSHKEHNNYFCW